MRALQCKHAYDQHPHVKGTAPSGNKGQNNKLQDQWAHSCRDQGGCLISYQQAQRLIDRGVLWSSLSRLWLHQISQYNSWQRFQWSLSSQMSSEMRCLGYHKPKKWSSLLIWSLVPCLSLGTILNGTTFQPTELKTQLQQLLEQGLHQTECFTLGCFGPLRQEEGWQHDIVDRLQNARVGYGEELLSLIIDR